VSAPVSPAQALELLEEQVAQLAELRNASTRDAGFKQWRQTTLTVVQRIWPTDPFRSERFRRVPFSAPSTRMDNNQAREFYERGCGEAANYLKHMIEELKGNASHEAASSTARGAGPARHAPAASAEGGVARAGTTLGPTIDLPLKPRSNPAAERSTLPKSASAIEPQAPAKAPIAEETGSRPGSLKELLGLADLASPVRESRAEVFRESVEAVEPLAPPRSPPLAPPPRIGPVEEVESERARTVGEPPPPPRRAPVERPPHAPVERPPHAPAAPAVRPLPSRRAPMEPPSQPASHATPVHAAPAAAASPPATQARPHEPRNVDAASEFLRTSPVLAAEGRPVHRAARPPATPPTSPGALALGALAADLARLGVPEGQRASARAALLDLGRQIQEGTLTWQDLRGAVNFVMGFPPLARHVLPLLLPYLDLES